MLPLCSSNACAESYCDNWYYIRTIDESGIVGRISMTISRLLSNSSKIIIFSLIISYRVSNII